LYTVFIYDFNRETGKLTPTDRNIKTAPGDGPRHLDFHMAYPDKLYLITEMKNDVYVLHKKNDRYEVIQKISSIPKGCAAENTAAAIRFTMGGSRLLVSNRGDNSIAVFSVNHDGTLNAPVFSPSGGDGPRDINLIGDHSTGEYVISANQNSGEVVIYKLEDDNTLTYTGIRVQAGSPTCVVPAVL
jgi:6-phosphogluconolactonase